MFTNSEMATTYSITDIARIDISQSCLQGPCAHTVTIEIKGHERLIVVRGVVGAEILRLLRVKKMARRAFHFNWFIEGNGAGWNAGVQKAHMDKEPVKIGGYLFEYPPKYKPKMLKPTPPPPTPRPKKLAKDDEPSEAGLA